MAKKETEDVAPARYEMGRIPCVASGADGNEQVESAEEMEKSTVKKLREKQLGSNGYRGE